jgi:hypothetical protein
VIESPSGSVALIEKVNGTFSLIALFPTAARTGLRLEGGLSGVVSGSGTESLLAGVTELIT